MMREHKSHPGVLPGHCPWPGPLMGDAHSCKFRLSAPRCGPTPTPETLAVEKENKEIKRQQFLKAL